MALAGLVAGCGGRVSRPVALTTTLDQQLSCAHLKAEYENNMFRIDELVGERHAQMRDNVGFAALLLSGPLFLDLKDTEKKEIAALMDRNTRLGQLGTNKSCPSLAAKAAPAPTTTPTPAPPTAAPTPAPPTTPPSP
jgi:hypothetical protein